MPQFVLLLYRDPGNLASLPREQQEQAMGRYLDWGKKPFVVAGGKRLTNDAGRVIRSHNGHPHVVDGPFTETKEVLGGFYLIEAADYDEAVRIGQDHPHCEFGVIEIRQVLPI